MPADPTYRRPLNSKQLTIIRLIFRFRFATSQLLGQTLNIPQRKAHERLQILLAQKYIGRKDEAGFRKPGEFAVYYLTETGVAALTDLPPDPRTKALVGRIVGDASRPDRFIQHCLGLFQIYCELNELYGERMRFFTKSDLGPYTYFPSPLIDAYIRLDKGSAEQQFFLEYADTSVPTRAAIARLEQLSDYADEDDWAAATRSPNPVTLFVVDKPTLQKKLQKYITDELDNNPLVQVASKGELRTALEI